MNKNKQAEPVAWMYECNGERHLTFTDQSKVEKENPHFPKSVPLYTHPAPAVAHEPVAGWIKFVDGKQTQNFCRDKDEMQAIDKISRLMNKTLNITYHPVYTHPAPAVAQGEPRFPFAGFDPNFCPGSNPENPQEAPAVAVNDDLAKAIHYPQCWDVAAYPTLAYAISELATCFQCCECVKSPAVAVNEQLLRAAKKYFVNYCLDEASEFFAEDTGCSQEQHDDAVELREAIVAAEAAKGGV